MNIEIDPMFVSPSEEASRMNEAEFNRVLIMCSEAGASDITLQTDERVSAEVHGRYYRVSRHHLDNTELQGVINMIYGPNASTEIKCGRDVDTAYSFKVGRSKVYRYRVNATGGEVNGNDGMQITIRTIPGVPPKMEDLGVEQTIIDNFVPKKGLVLVTGATGQGKSTLLAANIRSILENPHSHKKIVTFESPIEFVYADVEKPSSSIFQSEVPRDLPSFSDAIRNAMRRAPKVILLGEARDAATIGCAVEAAATGHLVYATVHSSGVAETVQRMALTFPGNERISKAIDIIESLRMIVSQQLVPRADGNGRVALREFLVFDSEMRERLVKTDDLSRIVTQIRGMVREYGQTMESSARQYFNEGLISERDYELVAAKNKASGG